MPGRKTLILQNLDNTPRLSALLALSKDDADKALQQLLAEQLVGRRLSDLTTSDIANLTEFCQLRPSICANSLAKFCPSNHTLTQLCGCYFEEDYYHQYQKYGIERVCAPSCVRRRTVPYVSPLTEELIRCQSQVCYVDSATLPVTEQCPHCQDNCLCLATSGSNTEGCSITHRLDLLPGNTAKPSIPVTSTNNPNDSSYTSCSTSSESKNSNNLGSTSSGSGSTNTSTGLSSSTTNIKNVLFWIIILLMILLGLTILGYLISSTSPPAVMYVPTPVPTPAPVPPSNGVGSVDIANLRWSGT